MESRTKFNKAVFYVYKAINDMTPDYICELLTPMSDAFFQSAIGRNWCIVCAFVTHSSISWFFFMLSSKVMELIASGSPKFRVLNAFKTNVKSLC